MITLETPIIELKGIGKAYANKLKRMHIVRVSDLLNHFPSKYEDFRMVIPINAVKGNTYACVKGTIRLIRSSRSFRKRIGFTECILEDTSGSIQCIWLNQPYITKTLHEGDLVSIAGKVSITKYGIQFINPMFEPVTSDPTHTARVVPLYPLTSGLTQKFIRSLIKAVLPLAKKIQDTLSEDIRKKYSLMPLGDAYAIIHFPITSKHAAQARERIALQELASLMLSISAFKNKVNRLPSTAFSRSREHIQKALQVLPFTLTDDQKKSIEDITKDISENHPMNRMINGDVGTGKTIIAHLVAHVIALQKGRTVLLAPTEILAQQHFESFQKHIHKTPYTVALLTRSFQKTLFNGESKDISRADLMTRLKAKEIQYVIGTHTLLQKTFTLDNLSCVIVDEQHRFGVEQRAQLLLKQQKEKNVTPHFLSLTATPIPRSLARIMLGGADISILQEKPFVDQQITTTLISPDERTTAYAHMKKEIIQGHQVFVICPLIDESDTLGVTSVTEEQKMLSHVFTTERMEILHGKLSATKKEEIMNAFTNKEIDILIATAVVEVGIDIPNATSMLIEGADRFGLAQLHQFRGRIGRSSHPSTCFVVQSESKTASIRLQKFASEHDGFALAEFDLKNRGPGTILGTIQSGFQPLKLADAQNPTMIEKAQHIVRDLRSRK